MWEESRSLGRAIAAALAAALFLANAAAANDAPAMMRFGGGYAGDIIDDRNAAGIFAFEYQAGPELQFLKVRPSLGFSFATNAAIYGWLGLNLDIYLGKRIVLTPGTAVGGYSKGEGQDLGGILEFKNGLDIAWRYDDWTRLGVGFHYMSNYGTGRADPGIATVMIFYAHPLGGLAR